MTLTKVSTALLFLSVMAGAQAAPPQYCGAQKIAYPTYGPYDYRMRAELVDNFKLVEGAHFTADVENGIKGSTGYLGGDLHYTLTVFPNHLRALATLTKLALRSKEAHIPNMTFAVECYFFRAVRYAPDDAAAWTAYGNYLHAMNKPEEAFSMFKRAVEVDPTNPALNYNVGLAYFSHKDYGNALKHAQFAYAAGYPLPGLKKKLIDAGKWVEPSKEEPPVAAQADKAG